MIAPTKDKVEPKALGIRAPDSVKSQKQVTLSVLPQKPGKEHQLFDPPH